MPSIDSLPPDQRAVLELVLRRGRTYDEIAQLLSIDRAGVRQRALTALDALGPEADVPAERRALITDYLLGALPPRVTEQVRERLAESPAERAWARVIASELAPIASGPLPEIPSDLTTARAAKAPPEPAPEREPERAGEEPPAGATRAAAAPVEEEKPRRGPVRRESKKSSRSLFGPRPPVEAGRERPPSRRGGMLVLIAAGVIVLAIVLSLVLSGGSSKKTPAVASTPTTSTTPTTAGSTGATGSTGSTASTGSTGPKARLVAQVNLRPPSGAGSAAGIAEILKAGANQAVAIIAQHLSPNGKHDAYAVWLYNSPTDSHLLGFVSPPVSSNGQLRTEGTLPANASHYHKLIVTLETQASPASPGKIALQGNLSGLS
jgi:hypothetical protein